MVYGVGELVHTVIEENRIPSLLRKNGYLLTIYDKPYEPCSNRRLSTDRLCLFSFFQAVLVIANQCFYGFFTYQNCIRFYAYCMARPSVILWITYVFL